MSDNSVIRHSKDRLSCWKALHPVALVLDQDDCQAIADAMAIRICDFNSMRCPDLPCGADDAWVEGRDSAVEQHNKIRILALQAAREAKERDDLKALDREILVRNEEEMEGDGYGRRPDYDDPDIQRWKRPSHC